jgi:Mrp family chromosome partitioning ATPase
VRRRVPARRWALVLVLALAGAAVGLGLSLARDKRYSATSAIVVESPATGAPRSPQRDVATAVGLLRQGVVDRRVASALGGSIGADVRFDADDDSDLVVVRATAGTGARAARVADAYADAYVAYRRRAVLAQRSTRTTAIRQALAAVPDGPDADSVRGALRAQLGQLAAQAGTADVRRAGVARPPRSADSRHVVRNALLGALAGLLAGLALVALRQRLDPRLRHADDVQAALGLAVVARIRKSRLLAREQLATGALPEAETESLHALRAEVERFAAAHPDVPIVVAAAGRGEGATTVAWQLACAASAPERRVLLIEADMRRPTLSDRLGGAEAPGLAELAEADDVPAADAIRQVAVATVDEEAAPRVVDLILAGDPVARPADVLASDRARELLDDLARSYDLVVIDAPPLSAGADLLPLLASGSGVVVVGRPGTTTRRGGAELREALGRFGPPVVGLVVNGA